MSDASAGISIDPKAVSADMRPGVVALQCAILASLIYLIFNDRIAIMIFKWKTDGNWSHGWLVPVFSLYFLGIHRQQLRTAVCKPNYLGALVIAASLGMYYGAIAWGGFGYPQSLAIIPCMLGMVLLIWGNQVFRVAWFPICYLVFAIPLPRSMFFRLTLPLREFASQVSGWVLGLLPKVYTSIQGVVIDYEHGTQRGSLNVEEACSGMRLMMAFCSLGVAMAYLGDRPLWQRIVMILCCVPIAVFCNMIRVLVTGIVHVYGREDLAQGTAHGLLGLAMLPIALGLFALVGYILSNLVVDIDEEPQTQ